MYTFCLCLYCADLWNIARNYYILMTGVNFFAGKLKKLQLVKIDQNRLLCLTPAIGGCVAYWFSSLMGGVGDVWI